MEGCWNIQLLAFIILLFVINLQDHGKVEAGCPFQNPFWFVEKPVVFSVMDENAENLPNKVRIMWGRMENFKCVDYFQVGAASAASKIEFKIHFSTSRWNISND
jgi:hypothetical protein